MAEIHEEMSELLDKQVNVQKESLKKLRDSRKLPRAHEKVCDENERKTQRKKEEKNDGRVKKIFVEGRIL